MKKTGFPFFSVISKWACAKNLFLCNITDHVSQSKKLMCVCEYESFYVQLITFKSKIIGLIAEYITSNAVTPTKKMIKSL